MDEQMKAEAARNFSHAADVMVDACRRLEQCGLSDPPIERLLQALDEVTHAVHQMHRPDDRIQIEPADMVTPACHIPFRNGEDGLQSEPGT